MKVLLLVGVVAIVVVIVLLVGLCMVVMAGFDALGSVLDRRRARRIEQRTPVVPSRKPESLRSASRSPYPAEISAESTSVKRVNAATSPGSEWLTRGQA